jgi:hypothetical protein
MMERLYYVRCNGCSRACAEGRDLQTSGVDARALAKRHGWMRIPRRTASEGGSPGADYCPTCAASKGGTNA